MKAYQFTIELVGIDPPVWRRVIIPADVTFRRLHDTIQTAMGWWDYHLYEFEIPQEKLRITNNEEAFDEFKFYSAKYRRKKPAEEEDPLGVIGRIIETTIRLPQTVKIDQYLVKYKSFEYVYDLGDNWRHLIELETIIDDYKFGYPVILDGEGACPPEDAGGIGGYQEFLEAWNDPGHPEHEEMREWGDGQRYRNFDIEFNNGMLKSFLKIKKTE
ncbi:MAG: plasmid pRiA4b ORF-3 family protein [Bacillota bacterium]